ncbi:hypothetical protein FDUTEX481_03467 [Tolypothrix sp. PCC 7601]|nr:hypothetical protein FDUTEX481_03467 [Tolypothrix sp. PCC 7601]
MNCQVISKRRLYQRLGGIYQFIAHLLSSFEAATSPGGTLGLSASV